MVEAATVDPFPKFILDQLPFTGLASLEVKRALVAVSVPYTVNAIPELNRISTPAGTVRVMPAFTVMEDVTM